MKKEKTVFICERCGMEKEAQATKIGPFRKSASYPKDWVKVNKKLRVCPNCAKDFNDMWNKYLMSGTVKDDTKIMVAKS